MGLLDARPREGRMHFGFFFFCVYFFESPVETVMDNFYFYFTCCIGEKGHTMDG